MINVNLVCTVTSAQGNNVNLDITMQRSWWDENNVEHIESETLVFDQNGRATYETKVIDFEVPADFNGTGPMGQGWKNKMYDANLIILSPEIRYVNGKITVKFSMHFEPVRDPETGNYLEYFTLAALGSTVYLG